MPAPFRNPHPPRQQPNLRSKRLIYLSNEDIFRFVEQNPYTCVQVVTYKAKTPVFAEMTQEKGPQMKFTGPRMEDVVRIVQYWNCEGFDQGERVRA